MKRLLLLIKLGYLLGVLGIIRCVSFPLVVKKHLRRQEREREQHLLPHALFKQEKPLPGVLTQEGMERMKRYMRGYPTWDMADGSSFQVHTPGYYDLTRYTDECSPPHFSLWEDADPDLFSLHDGIHGQIMGQASWWSESDLNELKWEQGAQVQREATDIVNELWNPPLT